VNRVAPIVRALAIGACALSGCAAAVVPVAAAGVIGKGASDRKDAQSAPATDVAAENMTLLPAGSVLPPPTGVASAAPEAQTAAAPAGIQYLYGSGEAAAVSVQAWRELVRYVATKASARPADSVVLAPGATLATPTFVPCGDKPLAAVFDVDETVLLNLGFEYDAAGGAAFDEARWAAWERAGVGKSAAVPGAAAALEALRTMGVTVVFNTNRSVANAIATEQTIAAAGLGTAKHKETLFLKGDDSDGSFKDRRRATIAARYCVIAMGGDQLGDFSDLFNRGQTTAGRRAAAMASPISTKWGAGWFILPNPAYGSAMRGTRDEIFPAGVRWAPGDGAK
jgi:5'-nucleotidase (lipoprotein e(P4) family)